MHAFAQILTGDPVAVIRCGPRAINHLDPYDYAVVMEVLGQTALIHALVANEPPEGRFGMQYISPILRVVRKFGTPEWDGLTRKSYKE